MLLIAIESRDGVCACEVTGSLPLPFCLLTADAGQLQVACTFSDCAEGCTRFDRVPGNRREMRS